MKGVLTLLNEPISLTKLHSNLLNQLILFS